jgi:hypothetical protein
MWVMQMLLFVDSTGGVLLRNLQFRILELVDCGPILELSSSSPFCPLTTRIQLLKVCVKGTTAEWLGNSK